MIVAELFSFWIFVCLMGVLWSFATSAGGWAAFILMAVMPTVMTVAYFYQTHGAAGVVQ